MPPPAIGHTIGAPVQRQFSCSGSAPRYCSFCECGRLAHSDLRCSCTQYCILLRFRECRRRQGVYPDPEYFICIVTLFGYQILSQGACAITSDKHDMAHWSLLPGKAHRYWTQCRVSRFERCCLESQLFCLLAPQFHRFAEYNCNSFATGRPVRSTTAIDYQDSTDDAKRPIRSAGARLARPRSRVPSVLLVADRVWRFSMSVKNPRSEQTGANSRHAHAYVIRSQCGHTFCLADVPVPRSAKLPVGDRSLTVGFSIRGLCADRSPEQASR